MKFNSLNNSYNEDYWTNNLNEDFLGFNYSSNFETCYRKMAIIRRFNHYSLGQNLIDKKKYII